MKHLVFLFTLLVFVQAVRSQSPDTCYAGVYLSYEDFTKNKLSHKINKNAEGNKLDFSVPADMTLRLKIVTNDSVLKFRPGTIYGYYDCGNTFRYSPGSALNAQEDYYKILEKKDLIIYSSAFVSGSEIFYSRGLNSPIYRLTKKDLERDFKDHPEFLKAADKLSKETKGDLAALNPDKSFRINGIFAQTVHPEK
jgi:hypothetical protein